MIQYSGIARVYDRLIGPETPCLFADRLGVLLRRGGIEGGIVLDLACGTGAVTEALAIRGYEMIGCDNAPEMLDVARARCADLPVQPVWICQNMEELDLYGTVRAAVCCLDSVNYLVGRDRLRRAFARVALFLEPDGLFLFDIKSARMFSEQGGTVSADEQENAYCVWQYGIPYRGVAVHKVDLFQKTDDKYNRFTEEHFQQVYSLSELESALDAAGMRLRKVYQGYSSRIAREESGRLLLVAEKR